MPVMQFQTSVPAGDANPNFISGSAFEFARSNQVVSIGLAASADGAFVTITSGADLILEESPPYVIATAGVFPIVPDQMFYNDVMAPGDRLVIRGRNPTAGAIVFKGVIQISPL